jgi:hypothetical protein
MSPAGFEPTISAAEWPQTYVLERAATGTGQVYMTDDKYDVVISRLSQREDRCVYNHDLRKLVQTFVCKIEELFGNRCANK